MLDWPKENYHESFNHISFAQFSLLDEIETETELYSRALASADWMFFIQFDPSLFRIPVILADAEKYYEAAREAKRLAMENASDEYFSGYLSHNAQIYSMLREIVESDTGGTIQYLAMQLGEEYPDIADSVNDEAAYILQLIDYIKINLDRRDEINGANEKLLRGKFVIIGRVDTGTTDYGANPFHAKYINVGTHAAALDTILNESFLIPLGIWHRVLFLMLFIPLFLF